MQDMENILKRLDEIEERLSRIEREGYRKQEYKAPAVIVEKNRKSFFPKSLYSPERKKASKSNIEMELGGKWINRIGIIALIFAVAFFLKYSFDNNLVGPRGRVFIGAVSGISMLVAGDFFIKKYRIPSEGLIGGGIAALFFTVYAAFSFYGFIGQYIAFSLFALIVCSSAFMALRHDAVAIMHLGVLTGFLTPFLLASDKPNDIFFLSYIVILNLGIMIVSYYKSWKSLFYSAFFATHLCYIFWMLERAVIYDSGIREVQFFTGFIPMLIIFAEFLTVSLLMNISKNNKSRYVRFDYLLIFMNAMVCYMEGYFLLYEHNDSLLGLFTVIGSAIYIAIFSVVRKYADSDKQLLVSLLSVALVLITIAIPVQLDGRFVTLAWSVEAAALAYIFLKTEYGRIRVAYIGVAALALIGLVLDLRHIADDMKAVSFMNIDSLVYVVSVTVLFGMLWIIRERKSRLKVVLSVALNLLLLGLFLAEASNFFDKSISTILRSYPGQYQMTEKYSNMRNFVDSLIILMYSLVLIFIGFFKKIKSMRIFALALFLVVINKVFIYDLSSLEGIYRILSFVALGLILLGISFIYQRFKYIIIGGSTNDIDEDA